MRTITQRLLQSFINPLFSVNRDLVLMSLDYEGHDDIPSQVTNLVSGPSSRRLHSCSEDPGDEGDRRSKVLATDEAEGWPMHAAHRGTE